MKRRDFLKTGAAAAIGMAGLSMLPAESHLVAQGNGPLQPKTYAIAEPKDGHMSVGVTAHDVHFDVRQQLWRVCRGDRRENMCGWRTLFPRTGPCPQCGSEDFVFESGAVQGKIDIKFVTANYGMLNLWTKTLGDVTNLADLRIHFGEADWEDMIFRNAVIAQTGKFEHWNTGLAMLSDVTLLCTGCSMFENGRGQNCEYVRTDSESKSLYRDG